MITRSMFPEGKFLAAPVLSIKAHREPFPDNKLYPTAGLEITLGDWRPVDDEDVLKTINVCYDDTWIVDDMIEKGRHAWSYKRHFKFVKES